MYHVPNVDALEKEINFVIVNLINVFIVGLFSSIANVHMAVVVSIIMSCKNLWGLLDFVSNVKEIIV